MRDVTAIVHQDGESAFGLTFPDLPVQRVNHLVLRRPWWLSLNIPGCFAAADDWNAIPAAATKALDLWFEDRPDVQPSSLDVLRQSEAVKTEMAAGGILLPVPYIPADTAVERVNVTIERGLLRAIDATAKKRGMTRLSPPASAARHELTGA